MISSQPLLTFVFVRPHMASLDNPSRATKVATGFELRTSLIRKQVTANDCLGCPIASDCLNLFNSNANHAQSIGTIRETARRELLATSCCYSKSGRQDLNLRPLRPERSGPASRNSVNCLVKRNFPMTVAPMVAPASRKSTRKPPNWSPSWLPWTHNNATPCCR